MSKHLQLSRNLDRSPARWALAVLVLSLLAVTACADRTTSADAPATSNGTPKSAAGGELFSVPADQLSHVQIIPVATTRLPRVLRLTGTVTYNQFETTPVITQVSGPVTRILVAPGQVVRTGQPLLYVSSPDYAQLLSNYRKARDAYGLAQTNDARARDLYAHHAIALADLQLAESTQNQTQADLQAAEQALQVLGVQLDHLPKDPASAEIPVLAPIAGEIVERLASPGQVVQAGGTQVFTISNMSTVWVLANVYERDLGHVHMGDAVAIRTDAYTDTFRGRISYIAPAVDPTSRTLQVRIVTNNPGGKLKKDMYVTATVRAGVVENALTVPDAAVLRNDENQPFVYVGQGTNQFAQRLVNLGESQNGQTQILSGLRAGEPVVADGSLFLQFANSYQR
jgi:cobalt-zinc-cadmium efflux system membrane fusion protein